MVLVIKLSNLDRVFLGKDSAAYKIKGKQTVWSQYTHTHTHTFSGPFSETTRVSCYHKGKTSLDFTEARDSE